MNEEMTKTMLVKQLIELGIKPEVIERWFQKPNKVFNGESPNEIIKKGRADIIQSMIDDMGSGSPT